MFPFPQLWTFELKLIWQLNYCSRLAGKIKFKVESEIPTKRNDFSFSEFAQKQKREKDEAIWDVRIYCSICIVVLTLNELELFVGYFIHNPPKHTILDSWICIKTAIYCKDIPKMICWEKDNFPLDFFKQTSPF